VTIWEFQRRVSDRLLGINALNLAVGLLLQRSTLFARGFGLQSIGWSIINMLIAVIGTQANSGRATASDANTPTAIARETRNIRRILWLNAGLDVLYVLGGWRWLRSKQDDEFIRGNGVGVMVQGALLFAFDVIHALIMPKGDK
jgi:hypothetical protein